MALDLKHWRFTVDQYERMGKKGILGEDDRVELIGGEIVEMAAIGERHAGGVNAGNMLLVPRLGGRAIVAVQNPLRLPNDDEPQPDLLVLRASDDLYGRRHPTGADVLLLIEVADTTFRYDRRVKGPIYARHGIPDYWIVNLPRDVLIILRDPGPTDYRSEQIFRRGDVVAPLAFPDVEIAVADLLPRLQ